MTLKLPIAVGWVMLAKEIVQIPLFLPEFGGRNIV